jgi:small subunit ribosomal protein S20
MPIKKAAMKDMKKSAKRTVQNLRVKRRVHDAVKAARTAVSSGDAKAAEMITVAGTTLDRAAQKNVIEPNTAARTKSRLAASLRRKA